MSLSPTYTSYSERQAASQLGESLSKRPVEKLRPESFDGTRWSRLMQQTRNLALKDSQVSTRPPTGSSDYYSTNPPSPPLTDRDCSPVLERSEFLVDNRQSVSQNDTSHGSLDKLKAGTFEQRLGDKIYESSLWAELQKSSFELKSQMSDPPHDTQGHNARSSKAYSVVGNSLEDQLSYYAVMLHGDPIAPTVRLLYLWYQWLKFLSVLVAAVAIILIQGPEQLQQESGPQDDNILPAEEL